MESQDDVRFSKAEWGSDVIVEVLRDLGLSLIHI